MFTKTTTNTGAKLLLCDSLPPEDSAMLQALYSRSSESAEVHLERVRAGGSSRFMQSYVAGYNHKGIADCGSTTLYIEGVSLLAAKAIQNWPLYSGTETSTRYVDVLASGFVDPVGTEASRAIQEKWMRFYGDSMPTVQRQVAAQYPRQKGEDERVYERAVRARAFDILRGFLPAGLRTKLSWHTNLRQAGDHLAWLAVHPLEEVRCIAAGLLELLHGAYPDSGLDRVGLAGLSGTDTTNNTDRASWMSRQAFMQAYPSADVGGPFLESTISWRSLERFQQMLAERPRGAVLPHFLSDLGQITFRFDLDFGSFRDVQRHRNGVCRMPTMGDGEGYHPWYLEQLGELRDEAERLLEAQEDQVLYLPSEWIDDQYYRPLCKMVPCQVTYGLPAALYVAELRSQRTVHPTLRQVALRMGRALRDTFPSIAIYLDESPDDWDVRRGAQTIEARS